MADFVSLEDSIECQKADVHAKTITPRSNVNPFEDDNYYVRFHCKENAKAEIIEELNPPTPRHLPTAHINLHDTLKAFTIDIFTEKYVKVKHVGGYSGKHGIQQITTKSYTLGRIRAPERIFLLRQT